MWSIFSLSKEAGCRPSDLFGLTNSYEAYCFDEAVLMWGMYVSNEIREAGEGKKSSKQKGLEAKQERKFKQLIGTPDKKRFASPVVTTK